MPSNDYVCTLDEASLKVAKSELHEDPKERMGAVEALKKWIQEQPHITFTLDTRILLLYLRYGKFSQLKTREAIEKYCQAKTTNPLWYNIFNPKAEMTIKFLKTKFIVPLPGCNKKGQKRAIYRAAAYNPAEWKNHRDAMINAMYCMFTYINKDERAQVNGWVYLSDMTNLTFAHQTFFSLDEMKKMMKNWQNAFPARFKAFHHYNCGPVWEAMMAVMQPLLTKKFRDRIIMAGSNLEKLYKHFPQEILPSEYLPDDYTGPSAGTMDEIVDNVLAEMQQTSSMDYMSLISKPEWGIDDSKKLKDEPVASFRKLTVD